MKKLTKKVVAEINDVCDNKYYKATWLSKRVENKEVLVEDIYKFKDFFNIFEKNKRKFEYPNIHHYNTNELVRTWINECIEIQERNIVFTDIEGNDNYCNQSEIEKITKHSGNEYFGLWKGYQVFKIENLSREAYKDYNDVLGRIKGREMGAVNRICTFPNYDRYTSYMSSYGKNCHTTPYFLLFNLNDDKSPYQLHYESCQFMDRNDDNVLRDDYNASKMFPINLLKNKTNEFLDLSMFLGKNDERYTTQSYFDNLGFNGVNYSYDFLVPLDDNSVYCGSMKHKYKAINGTAKVKLLIGDRWTASNVVVATIDEKGAVLKYELINNKTGHTIVSEFGNGFVMKSDDSAFRYNYRYNNIDDKITKQYEYDTNNNLITEAIKVGNKYQVCGYDENMYKHFEGASSSTNCINICDEISEKIYRYPNGKKKKVERLNNGKLNGWVDYYNEKGRIERQERYNLGALIWQSDYQHKPLKEKKVVSAETFSKFRNELSANILKVTNKNNKISKDELTKRMSEVEKLQEQISQYADKIQELKEQIDNINTQEIKNEFDINNIEIGLKGVLNNNNNEITNYLAPFIDKIMIDYPKFQRYEIDKDCNDNEYNNSYWFPFQYTHKLGYMLKFKLVRSWYNIFSSDSDTDIVNRVNRSNFRFDIQLVNKNYSDIGKRNFGWGENSKYYGEISLNLTECSAKEVLEQIEAKTKFYAEYIHDRVR